MADETPILVAYDGSPPAQAALAKAAELFPGRAVVIATVWEPGLATVLPDPAGIGSPATPVDLTAVQEVDDIMSQRAATIAGEGAERAKAAGLSPTPVSTEDESNVAETLTEIAEKHDVAAVVTGSHGRSGLKARLLGSTSEAILRHSRRPVLVVRGE